GNQEKGIIKKGYSVEVDKLRDVLRNGRQWILDLEEKEKNATGIKSLKIKYNKVFGYFIEVTKPNLKFVPKRYIRKQTLVNSERYIIDELKEYENTVLGAEDRLRKLEKNILEQIKNFIEKYIKDIQKTAAALAELDTLYSLGEAASLYDYVKPRMDAFSNKVRIFNARHPVVERAVGEENFVANDLILDSESNMIMILTGPNMSGKSTYLRQAALITIMAQMGSFVPADEAELPLVDRVFTRIGAVDDISSGHSTFMVEMSEVADIINNATPSSLIVLDEVGRGTSTYDGLSLAWAIIEYLSTSIKAKTLFATHYHELTTLENKLPGVKNYNVTVREMGSKIVFLHKVVQGGTDKSYGIQVARLAGLPPDIIKGAEKVLENLESKKGETQESIPNQNIMAKTNNPLPLTIYDVISEIKEIRIDRMTPLEAINRLDQIQSRIRDGFHDWGEPVARNQSPKNRSCK
ncbi:MAG: DNA mismatch repair protein MutS, partial [Clostridia bacterium]|nr:DNA mismatch repair protein MutS [Clostridia bacterium]